jgi:hypothetical protein
LSLKAAACAEGGKKVEMSIVKDIKFLKKKKNGASTDVTCDMSLSTDNATTSDALAPTEEKICNVSVPTDKAKTCDSSVPTDDSSDAVVPADKEMMCDMSVTTDKATCDASENTVEARTCDALVQKNGPTQTQTRPDYEVQVEVLHRLMPLFEAYCDLATEKLKPMIAVTSWCEHAIRDWQKHMQEMETAFKRRSSRRHCRRSRSRRSPNHSEPFQVA